tara:strand:- start:2364 stop:2573 length:210 start_codon:yes stop_codon:yes gene_type:complete
MNMDIKKKFKVGDLVSVDHSEQFDFVVAETPNIKTGIVMKKMRTRDFYVVYYRGKYHTNVYCEWMKRLA